MKVKASAQAEAGGTAEPPAGSAAYSMITGKARPERCSQGEGQGLSMRTGKARPERYRRAPVPPRYVSHAHPLDDQKRSHAKQGASTSRTW